MSHIQFQDIKKKSFKVFANNEELILKGDEVFALSNGLLTTAYHAIKENHDVIVEEISDSPEKLVNLGSSGKDAKSTCEVKFVDGKLVKTCDE